MITQVAVRNFRSIGNIDLVATPITVLVGANDAGKSNILRALNLFFNGHTDPGVELNFSSDFNQYGKVGARKAKEIQVTVTFMLPSTYRRAELPEEVVWTKTWREGSSSPRDQTRTYVGGGRFLPRSRIDLLLDRIRFTYVPAVKDRAFFADLQGQLYDILSSVAAVPLRDSATVFEKQLQRQLSGLLDSISSVFDGTSVMRLPDNLREIFESLEISSDGIPLSRRGDGIKIRHIPMLLNFISKKQDEILNRGGIRYTHLWGFEEPENSVEMAACFKMAENLVGFIQEAENYQLFLTTHSPVFYRINTLKGCSDYNTIYIEKDDGNQTKASIKKDTIVDKVMGLMPLVSPFVAAEKLRFDSLQKQFSQIKELASKNKPTIFVEGITDAKILRKAFSIFAPEKMDLLHITEGDDEADYGSAAAVSSRALAWVLEMRHRAISDRTKALALFDADDAGAFERKKLIENINQLAIKTAGMLSVKSLPIPPFAAFLRKSGFAIPVALESFYSEEIWAHAKSENWLEEIADPGSLLSKELVNNLIANKGSPFESLSEIDRLRLKYSFKKEKKETVALYVIHSKRNKTVDFIQGMRQIVEIIVKEISI